MNKKYEMTNESVIRNDKTLYRIRALIDFGDIKAGDLGGYIEKEENLSHYNNAWVYGNAKVYDNAKVYGNAKVYDNADVCGDAKVYGNAIVCGIAEVCGDAKVYGNADYTTIKGFDTRFGTTTFFKCKDGLVRVSCGCFYGTIEEFREQVKATKTGKLAKEYLMIADLMEYHFDEHSKD